MSVRQREIFAELVRRYRLALGLTQQELAERAGISPRGVRALEAGERSAPQRETVRLLADALQLAGEARRRFEVAARLGGALPEETTAEQRLPVGGFLGSLPSAPLVGREHERDRIAAAGKRAAGGQGQLVFLAGEPGAGKTRLGQEATRILQQQGFLVAAGTCLETQGTVPYAPLVEALSTLAEVSPHHIRRQAAHRWPFLTRLLPDLDGPVPVVAARDTDAQPLLFRAVVAFVQAIASERPVALLLDDLHWADAATLALLSFLARQTRADPVLVLGTYRDTDAGPGHPLRHVLIDLRRLQLVEEIAVLGLSSERTSTLIAQTLGQATVAASLVATVYERTDGNPFFVQELVRSLADQGHLGRPDAEIPAIIVPTTVRSVLVRRIAGLEDTTQQVLYEASVLGQRFGFDELVALSQRDEATVEWALEEAQRIGLVRETGVDMYAFNHALTQHALLSELSGYRRRRLHGASGRALEELPEREQERRAAELAWHFSEAGEEERALTYTLRAGDSAERVFAYEAAERHYRSALQLARRRADREHELAALEMLGNVLAITTQAEEALDVLESAAALARRLDRPDDEGRIVAQIGRVHQLRGTVQEGIARLQQTIDALSDHASPASRGLLHTVRAFLLFAVSRNEESLCAAEYAAGLARLAEDERILAEAQHQCGVVLNMTGRPKAALPFLERAIAMADRVGDLYRLGNTLQAAVPPLLYCGRFEEALAHALRSLETHERLCYPVGQATSQMAVAHALFVLGRWEEAGDYAERSVSLGQSLEAPWFLTWCYWALGMVRLAQGAEEEGRRAMDRAMSLAQAGSNAVAMADFIAPVLSELDLFHGRPEEVAARVDSMPGVRQQSASRLLPLLAEAYLQLDDTAGAASLVAEGLPIARRDHHRLNLLSWLRAAAHLTTRRGDLVEASTLLDEALSLARSMTYPFMEAQLLTDIGRLSLGEGRAGEARTQLDEALMIFRRLGARPYLERTDRALAALDQGGPRT